MRNRMFTHLSSDLETLKKVVSEEQNIVSAVELPSYKTTSLFRSEIEDILTQFEHDDDSINYAHFIIKVRRSDKSLLQKSSIKTESDLAPLSENSLQTLVNETMELSEKIQQKRISDGVDELTREQLLESAQILEQSKDFVLAKNIYRTLIEKGLGISEGLQGLARCAEGMGDLVKAEKYYREALAYSSETHIYQALISVQILLGKDEEAAKSLVYALGLIHLTEHEKFEFHKSLGNCYTRLNQCDKAEYHYHKAYEINPKSDILQVNVGTLAIQKGDIEIAKLHLQQALELNPRNDKAINGLGMIALSKKDVQKAHDYFASSLEIQVNNVGAIYNLVKCAYELKSFDTATRHLENYMKTVFSSSVNTNILYSFCGVLFHQRQYNVALQETERLLKLQPHHSGAKELKIKIENKLKQG